MPLRLLLLLLWMSMPLAQAQAAWRISFEDPAVPDTGVVAIAVAEGLPADGAFAAIDARSGGALRRLAQAEGFRGRKDSVLDLRGFGGYDRLLVVGLGEAPPTRLALQEVGGSVAQAFGKSRAARVELVWDGREPDAASQLAFGAALGQYRFDAYRTSDEEGAPAGDRTLVIRSHAGGAAADDYVTQWQPVAAAVAFARDLVNEPANALTPEAFVSRVQARAQGLPLRIEVLDVPAMQRLGMDSLLAVGQGSVHPPRLLLLSYQGGEAGQAPLAFVGKGITFDSGGISIKASADMWRMKSDMAGAASSVAAVLALAGRKAKVNAVAVAALAENLPSGSAIRPGDVVRTAAGKTYEIISTDAEGRMVLVDALWYVQRQYRPSLVIDLATLTGTIVTALGGDYAGLFSRDDALAAQLLAAGEASGELLWRMPLREDYAKRMKSPIADMRNTGGTPASGTAAWFIAQWVPKPLPWAHIDMAGSALSEGARPTGPEGATGYGVRLLDRFVRDRHE
ncbi:MAG: leucyl aminopeptidase [Proteobacteria bacterium]|nr:leucyl aminopeptidase [Pseudomonadota bacterium]